MKKLLSLIGVLSFTGVSTLNVISCGQVAIVKKPVKYLSTVVKNRQLGNFSSVPSKEEIKEAVFLYNQEIDLSQIVVSQINLQSKHATIHTIPSSQVYLQEEINVYYTYLKPLSDDLTVLDLEVLPPNPTVANIIFAVERLNPNLVKGELTVQSYRQYQAVVQVKTNSTIYQANSKIVRFQVEGSYSQKPFELLTLNTDLGTFSLANFSKSIVERFIFLNSIYDFQLEDFEINNIRVNGATIKITDDSTLIYSGSVDVIFNNK